MNFNELRFLSYPENFEEVKTFYLKILKLPIIEEWDSKVSQGVMFKLSDKNIIEFIKNKNHVKKGIQGCQLSIEVNDVNELYKKLQKKVKVLFKIRHNPWGDTSFSIEDPQGLQLTFFTKD